MGLASLTQPVFLVNKNNKLGDWPTSAVVLLGKIVCNTLDTVVKVCGTTQSCEGIEI